MSLSMICQLPINQLYSYPIVNNVITIKHLGPCVENIVVLNLRVVYIIITIRISYDNPSINIEGKSYNKIEYTYRIKQ
jgi:hypothetical protein